MNTPVTTSEMKEFKLNSSKRHIGGKTFYAKSPTGEFIYYPNRKERRRAEFGVKVGNNKKGSKSPFIRRRIV